MENYFISQRENIFKNVEVLVYVFDVDTRDEELKKDFKYYQTCINALYENSPNAKVFCLIHKMDLIQEDQKDKVIFYFKTRAIFLLVSIIIEFQVFSEHENEIINISKPITCTCFKSSIWDETLYRVRIFVQFSKIRLSVKAVIMGTRRGAERGIFLPLNFKYNFKTFIFYIV